jgi:hypothetical protein
MVVISSLVRCLYKPGMLDPVLSFIHTIVMTQIPASTPVSNIPSHFSTSQSYLLLSLITFEISRFRRRTTIEVDYFWNGLKWIICPGRIIRSMCGDSLDLICHTSILGRLQVLTFCNSFAFKIYLRVIHHVLLISLCKTVVFFLYRIHISLRLFAGWWIREKPLNPRRIAVVIYYWLPNFWYGKKIMHAVSS